VVTLAIHKVRMLKGEASRGRRRVDQLGDVDE
jgi:hypothetical protein